MIVQAELPASADDTCGVAVTMAGERSDVRVVNQEDSEYFIEATQHGLLLGP